MKVNEQGLSQTAGGRLGGREIGMPSGRTFRGRYSQSRRHRDNQNQNHDLYEPTLTDSH